MSALQRRVHGQRERARGVATLERGNDRTNALVVNYLSAFMKDVDLVRILFYMKLTIKKRELS